MDMSKDGYIILSLPSVTESVQRLSEIFFTDFITKFTDNTLANRNIIKRFADLPETRNLFSSHLLIDVIRNQLGLEYPVFCGPTVTHYTSLDLTGGGYSLPYHQDYPSMASSANSIILWITLTPSSPSSHGIELLPGSHRHHVLPGNQTERGFVTTQEVNEGFESFIPNVNVGEVLAMSPFLVHRTYLNPEFQGRKLSISQRFDDFKNKEWAEKGYNNAYQVTVDRELYRKSRP